MFKYLDKLLSFLGIYIDNTFINDGLSYDSESSKNKSKIDNEFDTKIDNKIDNNYKINIINEEINKEIEITELQKNKSRKNSITNYDIKYDENLDDELIEMKCFCNNLNSKKENNNICITWMKNLKYKNIFLFLYSFFIFIVLSSIPSLYIYDIFVNNNKSVISNASFTILQPILYIIIRDVFKSNYFQKIYNHTHNHNYKEIHYCLPNEKRMIISILLFTIISSVISLYFHIENHKLYIYEYIPKWSEYIISLLYIFNWLYGRTVISLNIHIFFYVFLKLIKDLKYTFYKINPDNLNNIISSTPVADLLQDIINVRHNFNKAIYMLEYIYVASTICGAVSIAYMIDYRLYSSSNFVAGGLYIFMQTIFMIIISIVEKQREKLLILVKSSRFSEKYILRRDEICRTCIEIENELENDNIEKTNSKNNCFDCKNIDNKKNDIVCDTEDIYLDSLNNNHSLILRKNINRKLININNNLKLNKTKSFKIKQINKQNASIQRNVLNTFDYVRCSYEWVKSTGRTIDWMVLTKALSEEWDAFSLLGVRFDNGSAFKKAIATTSIMITIIKYFIHYLNL